MYSPTFRELNPRKGTETHSRPYQIITRELLSANLIPERGLKPTPYTITGFSSAFRELNPRKGTETYHRMVKLYGPTLLSANLIPERGLKQTNKPSGRNYGKTFRELNPRKGTETLFQISS